MNQQAKQNLLELAALAGGIQFRGYDLWYEDFSAYDPETDCNYQWNPYDNDGDAFRLAMKLDMNLFSINGIAYAMESETNGPDGPDGQQVHHRSDPCAAMRLAVVRVAVEIGKLMKVD